MTQKSKKELAKLFSKPPAVATPYDDGPQTEIASFPFNTLSNKGRRFTIRTPGGKEIKGQPGAGLQVVVLGSARKPNRSWYEKAYDADNPAPPDCQSDNGVFPAKHITNKQSKRCDGCKWNQEGTAANGKGKACSTNVPAVVVPVKDGVPRMELAAVWRINATSAFEKDTDTDNNIFSFMGYNRLLQANGWKLPNMVVEIKHDEEDEEGHLVTFQPLMGVTQKMIDHMMSVDIVPIARMISSDPAVINGSVEPDEGATGGYEEEAEEEEAEEEEAEEEEVEEVEEEEAEEEEVEEAEGEDDGLGDLGDFSL